MSLRLACAVMAVLSLAACAPNKPGDNSLEGKAARVGAVRVIARLAVEPATTQALMDAAALGAHADLRTLGIEGAQTVSETLPYLVAEVTPDQLRAMEANPRFDEVMEDRISFLMLAESGPLVGAPTVWTAGGRGAGQAVAILDTGVDAAHPFLSGRVTAEACFSTTSAATGAESVCPGGVRASTGAGAAQPCTVEGCEHGTHVAGIAAGRGERFSGIAPNAEVIAVQVFSRFVDRAGGPTPCRDSGQRSPCIASFTSDQIRALDHVRQLAGQRAVASVNMSLGGGRSAGACDADFTKPSIDQLEAAGVATVIAAGNNGFGDAVSFPGCISSAVTVGATTKADQVAPFSNRGPVLDVYAPGAAITSSVTGGTFAAFSGTSMAAPHVAGAFAALKSARPRAGVAEITRALVSTGVVVDRRPRIAIAAALQALPAASPTEAPPVIAAAATPEILAEIAALPADRPVRAMARARLPANATTAQKDAAVTRVAEAATAAGATLVEPMPGQPVVVVEGRPAVLAALMRSGAVQAMQIDRPAGTQ